MKVRGWIRQGDHAACGATVTEGDATFSSHGRQLAFDGAAMSCARRCHVVAGASNATLPGGRRKALHGDATSAGCPLLSTLNDSHGIEAGGGAIATAFFSLPWYAKLGGMPDFYGMAAGQKLAAYQMWAERVAPNRPWDHKPIIRHALQAKGIFNRGWQKYGQNDYFYDIWSNIHYGYVGVAVGFSPSELIDGAGLAQAASDASRDVSHGRWPTMQNHPQNGTWPSSADDVPDHISIQLGIDLYACAKPNELTTDLLLRKISAVPMPWGAGDAAAKRPHKCSQ